MTGFILFGIFAICLIIGVPISISLGVSATAMILFAQNIMSPATTSAIPLRFYAGLDSVSIMAIAFFVLAGNLMTKGGISRRIVRFASILVGRVRGGMAIALVLACAFFAALSGSAPATVIAIGSMLYADMVKEGYPGPQTAGLLVVSGGLGPVIPLYYHGHLLHPDRRFCQRYVQAGPAGRYSDLCRPDRRGRFLCQEGKLAQDGRTPHR